MIEGTNTSKSFFEDFTEEELQKYFSDLSGPQSTESVLENLERRRLNALQGGVNCIPLPFVRFRSEVPGIEQGQYVVITANQKTGKCFAKGTRIRMADNTIKNIEDIRVGDWVMSPNDEAPKQVLSLGSGKEQMYRVHSEMHDDLIVNESHIMYLHKCEGPRRKARYFTETIGSLYRKQQTIKNFRKYYQAVASDECEFGIKTDLPIEPYFYGLWLGDGSTKGSDITTADSEIVSYLQEYANRIHMKLTAYSSSNHCGRYNICRTSHQDSLGFLKRLENVTGCQKQHINRNYLNASVSDRYELLAGIIDSDGYLNKYHTGYQITMKDRSCIEDIQELARSLGMTTNIRIKHNSKYNKDYYVLCITGRNCVKIPVKLARKKCKLSKKDYRHFSFSIEPIGEGEYYGLTIGGNHLFLLEDYTIVHNTQIANYIYLFETLDYAFKHPQECSVHIIYFALEESVQKIIERYMSHLLWKLDGKRYSPTELRSTSSDCILSEEILDLLKSDKYQERMKFFEQCVQFETEDTNPTGILRVCEKYAKSVGVYKSHTIQSKGNSFKEVEVFDSYEPNDPNHYKIVIIDHIGLVDKEQGFKTKDAVDKMSEYFVKYLRNRYGYTCVAIQQQASETEGLEAMKQKKMVPSAAGLGDSKYTARDADLVLGLFDPSKFGLSTWLGYYISNASNEGLKNYGRFLYVLANRNGEMGGVCPLFFDGAVCDFQELPKPDAIDAVIRFYDKATYLKNFRHSRKLALFNLFNIIKKHGRK